MADTWDAPLDPEEDKDYTIDWSAEMAKYEDSIASAGFSIEDIFEDAGVVIHDVTFDADVATVWVNINNPAENKAELLGKSVPITCTVYTVGGRRLQKTMLLDIREK